MPTYYSSDCSLPNPKLVPYTNIKMKTLARNGLVLLYRNNNYSNTMKQCTYICDKNKIRWMNGDSNSGSTEKECNIDDAVSKSQGLYLRRYNLHIKSYPPHN